jgi:hypothetical protein
MTTTNEVIVLGPQRLAPTVKREIVAHGLDPAQNGLAAVTAGWEEREEELDELRDHLGGRVVGLRLHERTEDVYAKDPALLQAVRARHDRLRKLQAIYRLRLSYALDAARALLRRESSQDLERLLESERHSAIEAVRALDREHLEHIRAVHEEFEDEWHPGERDSVAHHREEIGRELEECSALLVAGGHVTVLLDRLRMFDVVPLLKRQPIFCWSAGAMALSERVVVFHDSPPQGPGNAEVLEAGLDVFSGLVPLPHASRRLRLDDPLRVGLFARRFGPAICAALDEGTQLTWDGKAWKGGIGTRMLSPDGGLEEVTAA